MNIYIYDQEWMGIMTPTEQDNDLQFCESCSCMTRGNPTCGKCGAWRETETMTPTEQDKELRALLGEMPGFVIDWLELSDELRNEWKKGGKASDFGGHRTFIQKYEKKLAELITADRKRVELEARIDENNMYIRELTRHYFPSSPSEPHIPLVQFYERIAELKAKQEEV